MLAHATGQLEVANSKIKAIKTTAYGYRDYFFLKIKAALPGNSEEHILSAYHRLTRSTGQEQPGSRGLARNLSEGVHRQPVIPESLGDAIVDRRVQRAPDHMPRRRLGLQRKPRQAWGVWREQRRQRR